MGTILFLVVGLPVTALIWIGAAWVVANLWADLKVKIAIGKQAEGTAKACAERAFEYMKRGY